MKIAYATIDKFPELHEDDRLTLPCLAKAGVSVEPAIWTDPGVEWERFDAVVVRSLWNYFLYYDEFLSWLGRLEKLRIPVFNSIETLRWNSRKSYLREFEEKGVSIAPSEWLPEATPGAVLSALESRGWNEAVLKPVVSAGGFNTTRLRREQVKAAAEPYFAGEAVLQPFLPEIESRGEWSLLFFGGEFSHAVLKTAAPLEFRVQTEHGGATSAREPSTELKAFAERCMSVGVSCAGEVPLYARVDLLELGSGPILMELEMIEPFLYLENHPKAPVRFAEALVSRLKTHQRRRL